MSAGETYEYSVADPAIFANIGFVDKYGGQTIGETFARNGIMFIPASNRRVDGWNLMHQYLSWTETSPPKLLYFKTCFDSIRTIPALVHDENRPEDVDTKGEDHCFVGNTLVDTFWGKRKIRDLIGKSIHVNTLNGFKLSKNIRKTRKSMTYTAIFSNGVSFRATPDHKFLTTRGWIKLENILLGYDCVIQSDICIMSYLRLFKNLMGKDITYAAHIFKNKARDFILWFGIITMGKYLRDFMYTIGIMIGQIMIFPILRLNPDMSIYLYTQEHQKHESDQEKNVTRLDIFQQNGINRNRERNGIQKWREILLKTGSGLKSIVWSVINRLKFLNNLLIEKNTVLTIVKLIPGEEEWVYDLSVPDTEHFTIEGGIVVHNCADVDRYMLMSLHERKGIKPLSDVERKLKQMKELTTIRPSNLNEIYHGS